MKKIIVLAIMFTGTLSILAQEFTRKGLVAKATSSQNIQKVSFF